MDLGFNIIEFFSQHMHEPTTVSLFNYLCLWSWIMHTGCDCSRAQFPYVGDFCHKSRVIAWIHDELMIRRHLHTVARCYVIH